MKKLFLLLALFLMCHLGMAQTNDSIWKPFEAKFTTSGSIFQGNGYRIRTESIEIPPYKSRVVRYLRTQHCKDEDYYWSLAEKLLGCYKKDITFSKEGDISIYSCVRHNYMDSVPTICTAYIQPVTACLLSGVAFSKQGVADTVYQRQLVDKIWNCDIPHSVYIPNSEDTIYFLRQKIINPQLLLEKNKPVYVYDSELKSFRSNYYKFGRSNDGYIVCSWDSYLTDEAVEQARGNLILDKKKESKILFEGKDTILFRGCKFTADRIVSQNRSFRGGYEVTTTYLAKVEFENMPVLIHLNQNQHADSIGENMPLPSFIEENIFRLKNRPPAVTVIRDSIPATDTLFVVKKNRFPLWTYYDKNTRITGVSLGIGEINDLRNVTTNGLKLDVIGSSSFLALMLPFALVPPSEIMELNRRWQIAESAILYKNRFSITNGISFSVAGSVLDSHIINGIGFGGIVTINYRVNGMSLAGLNNGLTYNNGLQVAGLWATAHQSNGMQIGVLGTMGHHVKGVQIGAFNFAKKQICGLQTGVFNTATKSNGLQIGLCNFSKKLKGIQIGFWNKSDRRSLPFFNWGF
ncbi:hypothetical protein [uncultured Bacteroides sp.]|jgi:hypothetical protein|uniref:LA_2272 family surface repeat-containing protein n=1 Tax=uncultured Bacteroides sp. TaxID=162156 RepID=UPI00259A9121|nr:hypothetical protein [uncultured Bacteroides sp.]